MTRDDERGARLVEIARQWIDTKYHSMGRVKGAGVDCAMLPLEVYTEAGLLHDVPDVPYYPVDWALHRDEEVYLEFVEQVVRDNGGREVSGPHDRKPLPGDFLLFKFARTYSHGAIVTDWPECIHAHIRRGVIYVDALQEPKLAEKIARDEVKCFTFRTEDALVW